jgi:hypothetical protein
VKRSWLWNERIIIHYNMYRHFISQGRYYLWNKWQISDKTLLAIYECCHFMCMWSDETLLVICEICHFMCMWSDKTLLDICECCHFMCMWSDKTLLDICEGCHFIHMWKTIAWSHHITKRGGGLFVSYS